MPSMDPQIRPPGAMGQEELRTEVQSLSCSPGASSMSSLLFHLEEGTASENQEADQSLVEEHKQAPAPAGAPASSKIKHLPRRAPALAVEPEDQDINFNPERYLLWHKRALLQRARVGAGRSHEMQRLYHFWFNFLPDNFNEPMFEAFKRYAEEDASAGHTYGLTCLFSFFFRYLSLDFDTAIYDDFETLALKYQDYLGFMDGMDCLCRFLAGVGVSGAQAAPGSSASLPLPDQGNAVAVAPEPGPTSPPDLLKEQQQDEEVEPFCGGATAMQLSSGSSSAASSSSGKPHHFPGIPAGVKVEVDPRVVEQMQLWEISKLGRLHLWRQQQQAAEPGDNQDAASDAQMCGSFTGSSETGGMDADRVLQGEHSQRRRPGKGKASTWKGGKRSGSALPPMYGCSPPVSRSFGASPPGYMMMMGPCAGELPGSLFQVGSAPCNGLPPPPRTKHRRRSKQRAGGAGSSIPPPPPPPGSKGQPGGSKAGKGLHQAGGGAGGGPGGAKATPKGAVKKGKAVAAAGSSGVPLWEAQPCTASCEAAAELARALPSRLGELFGD